MAHATTSSIAKTKPKSFIFPVAFHGTKGGLHYVKMRFTLDGQIMGVDPNHLGMQEQIARTKTRAIQRDTLVRFVNWYEKAVGTNYGRGRFRAVLVYKLPLRTALNHPRVKQGWALAGSHFWFGE